MIETIVVGTLFTANLWWLVLPFRSLFHLGRRE